MSVGAQTSIRTRKERNHLKIWQHTAGIYNWEHKESETQSSSRTKKERNYFKKLVIYG